jgi:Fe-S-cluster containining protein
MSKGRKNVIQSMTPEQQLREDQLCAGLCSAERDAVVHILSQDRTPAGLMNVLNNATGFAETMAVKFRNPRTPNVDCMEGCNWCCYQTVPVAAPEAFAIADFIKSSKDPSELEATTTKLVDLNQRTKSLTPRERTKQHIPCAFLEDGKCSIYPVRPLACSEFTSMDVNDCKRAYRVGFKPKGIVYEKARMLTFYAIRQGLLEGLREALPSSDSEHYELTAAVIAALPAESAEAWLGGKNVFEHAQLILDHSATLKGQDGGNLADGK